MSKKNIAIVGIIVISISAFLLFKERIFSKRLLFEISSKKSNCQSSFQFHTKCLVVNNELFYDPIVWFEYREGYRYKIEVREEHVNNPPADGSSVRYTLLKIISMTKE